MIGRKSAAIFGFNIISAILGYIGIFFVARYMGAEPLGIVGFSIGYVGLFSFIADLGFGGAHIKRVSEGRDVSTCIGTYVSIKIVLVTAMTCCILGSIIVWKYVLGKGFESSTQEIALYIMIFYAILTALSSVFLDTFSAKKEIIKFQLPQFIGTVCRVVAMIAIVFLSLGTPSLVGAYLLSAVIIALASLSMFKNYPIGKYNKEYFKSYLSFALPIFAVLAITTVSLNIDKVMIQFFWNSAEVGYYFSMQKITDFIIAISLAVGMLLFPTISMYHAKGNTKEIIGLTQKAERYISLVVFPIVAFVIVFASQIIHVILSDDFLPAVPVLQMLALYGLITAINNPFWTLLGGMNRPDVGAKIAILMAVLNICLNAIFIPSAILGLKLFGMRAFGAALTTAISACVGLALTRVAAKKLAGATTCPKIFIHLVSAIMTGTSLYLIGNVVSFNRWFSLGCAGLVCIGIYIGILYCVGEFTKTDFHFFIDWINPRKMLRYMREELKQ